jgi:hypothetical protein
MAEQHSMEDLLRDAPSNWGKWGDEDELGSLNYLTPGCSTSGPATCSLCNG